MARTANGAGRHLTKAASNSRASRKGHNSQKVEKKNATAPANSITAKVISKRAAGVKGKQKVANATKKPNSRKRKRKAQEDSDDDKDDDKEEQDEADSDADEVEVAKATRRPKKAKTNTIPEGPQSKPAELPIASSSGPVVADGMSSKDAARLRANMEIMNGSDKIEYEALFMKMTEAKELISKLSTAQAERNKRLEELAKGARVKANAGKPAWVKKTKA